MLQIGVSKNSNLKKKVRKEVLNTLSDKMWTNSFLFCALIQYQHLLVDSSCNVHIFIKGPGSDQKGSFWCFSGSFFTYYKSEQNCSTHVLGLIFCTNSKSSLQIWMPAFFLTRKVASFYTFDIYWKHVVFLNLLFVTISESVVKILISLNVFSLNCSSLNSTYLKRFLAIVLWQPIRTVNCRRFKITL